MKESIRKGFEVELRVLSFITCVISNLLVGVHILMTFLLYFAWADSKSLPVLLRVHNIHKKGECPTL